MQIKNLLMSIGLLLTLPIIYQLPTVAQEDKFQNGKTCRVTDPTGSALNVRLEPGGQVINQLRNGRDVYIQQYSRDFNGKVWVLVAIRSQGGYRMMGYVLREFIGCY